MKPPKRDQTKRFWKLNTTLHRLSSKDDSRAWYLSVKQILIKTGATKRKSDGAAFYWYNGSKIEGILSSHVEDFLRAGATTLFYAHVIDQIGKQFVISKKERGTFK